MNYIVFDLEATCVEGHGKDFKSEIIEIGAVKLNKKKEIIDEFQSLIKPQFNPILTDFCKKLTTITQEEVDRAELFVDVFCEFKKWVGIEDPYLMCSWGFYDKIQIEKDCKNKLWLDYKWVSNRHKSLKHCFAEIYGIKPCGMEKALNMLDIPLNGTHHRGIDDARNIATIFKVVTNWGF